MKELREGFTTGSCAAAAALASCLWLRDGACPTQVEIELPEGRKFRPETVPMGFPRCGVMKDAGDDPDITNGMIIAAEARVLSNNGAVCLIGGEGVGMVTKPGLKIPPGEPAINPVPRQMIEGAVRQVFSAEAVEVTISIPGGAEVAKKTFNPRLGIEGGLSVLGTTGVVRPMSEDALTETIHIALKVIRSGGADSAVLTFGNQGEAAISALLPARAAEVVQMSNYVGFALDSALSLGFRRLLVAGHPGKLLKVSAGVMMTHSRVSDVRMEPMIAALALMGAPVSVLTQVRDCLTTEAAIPIVTEAGFREVWAVLARRAAEACARRVRDEMRIEAVMMDGQGRVLGGTDHWKLDV